MRLPRTTKIAPALVIIASLLLAACGGGGMSGGTSGGTGGTGGSGTEPAGGGAAHQGPVGTVVVAQGVDATTMDPHMQAETTTSNVLFNIFDALTRFDENNTLQPSLAESWRVVDDYTWEFVLRQGVRFHNGDPLTPEDVAYSIMRVAAPDSESPNQSRYGVIQEVQVIDDRTVHVITSTPYPVLAGILADLAIVSKSYAENNPDKMGTEPVGTGPFKFVSWERDQAVTLEANTDYWAGAPRIQTVIFRPIREDTTRLAELQTGGVHIITNVPPHTVAEIEVSGTARVESIPSTRYIFIGMNLGKDTPLRDVRVRQALNYAVDKEAIIDTVLLGHGFPMSQPAHAAHFGYNPNLDPYPYDPERARQLLAEAGYPDGFRIEMMTPRGRYLNDHLAAEAIAGQLAEVGVQVDLQVMEWGNYVGLVIAEQNPAPLYLLGWGSVPGLDADGIYLPMLGCNEQLSYYCNPELDELALEARATLDMNRRLELYNRAAEIAHEDAPWIYLWNQEDLYGVSNQLDWKPVSFERIWLYEASLRQ